MSITEKHRDEMLEPAKPLMRWLAENFHPHTMASYTKTWTLPDATTGVSGKLLR
jgi:hypothetical protein